MFAYTTDIINNLEKSLSCDRLNTYTQETNHNKENALNLYLWNSETSAAFYPPLQCLEIALRNSIHYELSQIYSAQDWYDHIQLNNIGQRKIDIAKNTIRQRRSAIDPPHMVAELSFGFWLSLLNRRYHQKLWISGLHKAFPHAHMKRSKILYTLNHLRILRNRIAHHEPIFKRHLEQDYTSIITSIGWICHDTARWTKHHHIVDNILSRKP
ncbi:MAG: Abi family protein [Alphaproteobacteria bacterium]|nr:Abi family protein [Alphaproteobacteria bacterium]